MKQFLALSLVLVILTVTSSSHLEADGIDFQPPQKSSYPKLGRYLSNQADVYQGSYWSSSVELSESLEPAVIHDLVPVRIRYNEHLETIEGFLLNTGSNVLYADKGVIYADIPVHILSSLGSMNHIDRVIYGHKSFRPSVVSEGSTIHNAATWNALDYRGDGIKVGIIDVGFIDYGSLMGSDLPDTVIARCVTSSVSHTNNLTDCEVDSKHGTAVAEAVFDIAPEAEFYIANVIYGPDVREATDWMILNGVNVINFSAGEFISQAKGDGTSPFYDSALNAVDDAVNAGIIWVNAAGNSAESIWYGTDYKDTDADGWIEINHDNYLSSPVEDNCINLSNDTGILVSMRWDGDWTGPSKDLDVFLYLENVEVAGSDYQQSGNSGQYPTEEFIFTSNTAGTYCIRIFDNTPNNKPDWVQLQVYGMYGESLSYYGDNLTQNSSHTIGSPEESTNSGMLAVGATHLQNTSEIASYSSQGPTVDGRLKPEITGLSNADSAIWGNWMGTSQSSPHVAGLAALILERYPGYTPQQVASYLKNTALPKGSTVPNNVWGYGLAFLPNLTIEVTSGSTSTAVEGTSKLHTVASFFTGAPSSTHVATINWGDGQSSMGQVSIDGTTGTVLGTHSYTEDGNYSVTTTITNDESMSDTGSVIVQVSNAPPVVTMESFTQTVQGYLFAPRATYQDLGVTDTHTAQIDWGDGTSSNADIDTVKQNVGASHVYSSPGDYNITISVTDDEGDTGNKLVSITVLQPNTVVAIPSVSSTGLLVIIGLIIVIAMFRSRKNHGQKFR